MGMMGMIREGRRRRRRRRMRREGEEESEGDSEVRTGQKRLDVRNGWTVEGGVYHLTSPA